LLELPSVSIPSRRFEATMIETTVKNGRNDEDDYTMMIMMTSPEDVAILEKSESQLI
jgi:hypothetical protein